MESPLTTKEGWRRFADAEPDPPALLAEAVLAGLSAVRRVGSGGRYRVGMSESLLVGVVIGLVTALILVLVTRRRSRGGTDLVPPGLATRIPEPGRALAEGRDGSGEPEVASPELTAERAALAAEVQGLLRANKKIYAVKLMRERTGLSLRDAKDAVEQVDLTGLLPPRLGPLSAVAPAPLSTDDELMAQLRHLKQRDRKIEAIKLLRTRTGANLIEAKQTIDRL